MVGVEGRVNHILHCTTKSIVEEAVKNKEAIVLEDIAGIRRLFIKGNGQGRRYRGMMNSWSFGEVQRQIEYKARWKGIPIIHLTKGETRNTSTTCPRCGERLQFGQNRQLWCPSCKTWEDRDVVAAKNLSRRGWMRFVQSLPLEAKGGAVEAMMRNPTTTVILRVDAPKSSLQKKA
jgi:putative transposase